jgi:hypothetical protein
LAFCIPCSPWCLHVVNMHAVIPYRIRQVWVRCTVTLLRAGGRPWPCQRATAPVHWDHVRTTHPLNTTFIHLLTVTWVLAEVATRGWSVSRTTTVLDCLPAPFWPSVAMCRQAQWLSVDERNSTHCADMHHLATCSTNTKERAGILEKSRNWACSFL